MAAAATVLLLPVVAHTRSGGAAGLRASRLTGWSERLARELGALILDPPLGSPVALDLGDLR
jgi:hypothetical protein